LVVNEPKEAFMKSFKSVTAVIPAFVLASGCATLENAFQESPLASAFAQFDEDGDGVISRDEAQKQPTLTENFSVIDTNDSGGVDSAEYEAAVANIAPLDFEWVDINNDGVISEREATAMPMSLTEAFGTIDADGDTNVSPTEYEAATVNLLDGVSFGSVDTDNDGVIDDIEAQDAPALSEAYDRADANVDGLISQGEFKRAQTQR
jgi:Ca2+-binding EF-hand superfamily protein